MLCELISFEHPETKVTEGKSECPKDTSGVGADISEIFIPIFANHIENSGKHDNENHVEEHKDPEINDGRENHGDDLTEAQVHPQEEEHLHQGNTYAHDRIEFRNFIPGSQKDLTEDVGIPKRNVKDV